MCSPETVIFSNEISFCRHETSFFHLKLFLRTKVSQNAFNFNQNNAFNFNQNTLFPAEAVAMTRNTGLSQETKRTSCLIDYRMI